jgi:hypothetical protein
MSKVPIVKNFTMGDCMAAQRRCENSSFEHAHYGALRCVTCAYRPVKGVCWLVFRQASSTEQLDQSNLIIFHAHMV